MPYLFVILAKANLVLALFAITYYLILRRLTFYALNRLFLVFGILFSSLYPFIDLTNFFHNQQQLSPKITVLVPAINQHVKELAPAGFMAKHHQLISMLFYAGVAIMAVRLLLQFVSLYRLHKNSSPGIVNDIPVRILSNPVSPFSFWQTIYINPSLHNEIDVRSILAHEYIHVKQWHSLDIILAELSVLFYWFNPAAWLMNKAVKENLEFITDDKVLKNGADKKAYQYSLLHAENLAASVAFTNSFNISDLKKRIQMMNARRSSRLTLSRYVLVLPVLLLTALLFTVSKKEVITFFAPVTPQLVYTKVKSASGIEPGAAIKQSFSKPHSYTDTTIIPSRELIAMPVKNSVQTEEVNSISNNSHYNTIPSSATANAPAVNPNEDVRIVLGFKGGPRTGDGHIPMKVITIKPIGIAEARFSTERVKASYTLLPPPKNLKVRVVQGYPYYESHKNQ